MGRSLKVTTYEDHKINSIAQPTGYPLWGVGEARFGRTQGGIRIPPSCKQLGHTQGDSHFAAFCRFLPLPPSWP